MSRVSDKLTTRSHLHSPVFYVLGGFTDGLKLRASHFVESAVVH